MPRLEVVLALGKIGFDGFLAAWSESGGVVPTPRPKFAHGARVRLPDGPWLLSSYHPSQQNTFTGRLTRPMFHRVFPSRAESRRGLSRWVQSDPGRCARFEPAAKLRRA